MSNASYSRQYVLDNSLPIINTEAVIPEIHFFIKYCCFHSLIVVFDQAICFYQLLNYRNLRAISCFSRTNTHIVGSNQHFHRMEATVYSQSLVRKQYRTIAYFW